MFVSDFIFDFFPSCRAVKSQEGMTTPPLTAGSVWESWKQ